MFPLEKTNLEREMRKTLKPESEDDLPQQRMTLKWMHKLHPWWHHNNQHKSEWSIEDKGSSDLMVSLTPIAFWAEKVFQHPEDIFIEHRKKEEAKNHSLHWIKYKKIPNVSLKGCNYFTSFKHNITTSLPLKLLEEIPEQWCLSRFWWYHFEQIVPWMMPNKISVSWC